ncbi:MAG: hypothetical protein M5R40_12255 [Anaerolineae bacterium]|nr:hypothetical protein [Anaerolineae bacterium]
MQGVFMMSGGTRSLTLQTGQRNPLDEATLQQQEHDDDRMTEMNAPAFTAA